MRLECAIRRLLRFRLDRASLTLGRRFRLLAPSRGRLYAHFKRACTYAGPLRACRTGDREGLGRGLLHVDRATDCDFPGPSGNFKAHDLRIQKVRTPAGGGQFHCHGMIDDVSQAPAHATVIEGVCFLPAWFGWEPGEGRGVVSPTGRINLTCHFSP